MLNSFKNKVKTLIFKSDSDGPQINTGIKRKRPFDDCADANTDVQCTSIKKPKLQRDSSSTLLNKIFSTQLVQNMSDWVQRKTPSLNVWRSAPTDRKDRFLKGNGLGDEQRRSESSTKTDSNGGSHHRFQKVDVPGIWPVVEKHHPEGLTRRGIHSHSTKSTPVQTDTLSDHPSNNLPRTKGSRFNQLFKTRNHHRFSAGESIRLGDKVRYQQLLQQFTTVPLEPPEISQPFDIQQPVVVPKLPRFYCNRNDSILGSNLSSWSNEGTKPPDKPKIKVHPSSRVSSRAKANGSTYDDSVIHITDISTSPGDKTERKQSHFSQQKVIDLTEDEEVQIISEERPSSRGQRQSSLSINRTQSPSLDYRESKFMSEEWIEDLNNTYGAKARERQRKIAEEEMRAKVLVEQRYKEDKDLERKIRKQMRIFAREPGVTEEPEAIEIESSSEEEEEEDVEETLPELTNEMENKINNCLRGGSSGQVLVDKFKIQITRADIATLSGLNWLNDEIINFYMNLLMERGGKDGMPKVHAFNTFFYPKVMSGGQSAVRRWTRTIDVLAVDYIIVPVHLGMHWCLSVINFKKKDIQYYDSMGGSNTECLNALKKYLRDESMDKKKKEFCLNGWTSTIVKDIPQQMNGSDCGMFACKFADYITRERPFTFSQEHMPYFRRRMVYEIVTAKLLQ